MQATASPTYHCAGQGVDTKTKGARDCWGVTGGDKEEGPQCRAGMVAASAQDTASWEGARPCTCRTLSLAGRGQPES